MQTKPSVQLGRSVMLTCYAGTLIWLVAVMHRLFAFSWMKATIAVLAPLSLLVICTTWI